MLVAGVPDCLVIGVGFVDKFSTRARAAGQRYNKARILEAVCDGVSGEAAERMSDMKKVDLVEAAEQLLAATDWLPAVLRTAKPQEQSDAPNAGQGDDAYSEAAE